jgi:hypothetical protein
MILVGTLLLAPACERDEESAEWIAVRDSASVTFIEVDETQLLERAAAGEAPNLEEAQSVGGSLDDSMFIRDASSTVRLSATDWLLGQREAPHLLKIEGGQLTEGLGRHGDGPGEFRSVDWIGHSEPFLSVLDAAAARVTVLDSAFAPIRTQPIDGRSAGQWGVSPRIVPVGSVPGGGLVAGAPFLEGQTAEPGVNSRLGMLFVVSEGGELSPLLSTPRTLDQWGAIATERGGLAIDQNPIFEKKLIAGTTSERLYVFHPEAGRIEGFSFDGELEIVVDPGVPVRLPEDADVEQALEGRLENVSGEFRATMRENLRTIISGGPIPSVDQFLAGPSTLWIWPSVHLIPSPVESWRTVLVVDPLEPRATLVSVPHQFRPAGVDRSDLWGFMEDSLEIERFVTFDISSIWDP